MTLQVLAFLISLAVAFALTPWVRRLAIRLRVMVNPGGRRVHTRPMPQWGGIAIFAGFTIAYLLLMKFVGGPSSLFAQTLGVLIAGAVIFTVGIVDDMKELSAGVQTAAIVGSALLLMTFGVRIQYFTNPFGDHGMIPLPGLISWLLTLCWVFGVTKTVDFMDGLDGLAAGIGAIAAGVLAIMAYYAGQKPVALMAVSLCGACIGFLRYNFNPAKIFMGTGGSQFIGFVLAAISIIGAFKVAAAFAIVLPILVFGVPIFDGSFVIIKRFINRQPLHAADKTHLHHRLLQRGLTHRQAVIAIYGICALFGAAALILFCLIRR